MGGDAVTILIIIAALCVGSAVGVVIAGALSAGSCDEAYMRGYRDGAARAADE